MNYVGIDWAYGRAAFCALGESGDDLGRGVDPGQRGWAGEAGLASSAPKPRALVEMMSGAVWVRDRLRERRLGDEGRPRPQGQGRRPARLQDRQGRRPGAGRALPARSGPGALGRLRPRTGRSASACAAAPTWSRPAPRPATGSSACSLSSGPADLPRPAAKAGWDAAPGAPRGAGGLAGLDLRAARASRLRWTGESIRSTASSVRSQDQTSEPGYLATIPGVGPLLSLTFAAEIGEVSRFPGPGKLDRLRRPRSQGEPVGRALGDRGALQGRLADAALGGGRGRQSTPGCPSNPWHAPLPAGHGPSRQEPGEVGRRPRASEIYASAPRLAPLLALQKFFGTFKITCLGELRLLSDRLTVPHGIERPRQLPGTICAPSAERRMSSTHPPAGSGTNDTDSRGEIAPLTAGPSSKEKAVLSMLP